MENLSPLVLAWCAASLMIAGVVKGISGIGIPLLGVSLLSMAVTAPQAVALLPVPIIFANLWQASRGGIFMATCKRFTGLLVAMGIGTFIGAALLSAVNQGALMLIIGGIVLAFVVLEFSQVKLRVPPRHHTIASTTVGLIGGVLGGMSSIFGPPIIMFLASLEIGRDEFVGTISTIYLFAGIVLGITLTAFGIAAASDMLVWSSLATAPLLLGLVIGQYSRRYVSEALFRKVLLVLLALIGLNLIRRGIV